MNRSIRLTRSVLALRLGGALALALAAGLWLTGLAFADSVSVGRATVEPDTQGTVSVEALDIGSPGLGAWSIDVFYDPDVVTVVGCSPQNGSLCNAAYAPDQVRIVGASASGLLGDTTLARITFRCDGEGGTELTLDLAEFADATVGSPQTIPADVEDGDITCSEQAEPQPPSGDEEPAATPILVNGLADAGSAGPSGDGASWLMAALAAAGLASLGIATAFRLRGRRA